MAITDETVKTALLPCDGGALEYAFNFKILSVEEIEVRYYDADGLPTVLTYGSDYTVVPIYASLESGGEVILTFTPTNGYNILIIRKTDKQQLYDPVSGGGLSAASIEKALDRAIMILQENEDRLERALLQDPSSTTTLVMPSATALAGHFLSFDASGDPIAADPTSVPVTAFMQTLLDDEDAVTGRATLGIDKDRKLYCEEDLTLPSATKGDRLTIFTDNTIDILQGDAENVINLRNYFSTTKGTAGKLVLNSFEKLGLIYRGDGHQLQAMSKLSNPGTLPIGNGLICRHSHDNSYLAVGHLTSPCLTIYSISGDTFTKLSNPDTLPVSSVYGVAWNNDSSYLATTGEAGTGVYVTIYSRSGDTFTKISDPATMPSDPGRAAAFSPDGSFLAIGNQSSPYRIIYDTSDWSTGTYNALNGDCYGVSWHPDGDYVAFAHVDSPYISIYSRSGSTFTQISDPANLPTGNGLSCAYSPDGTWLAVGQNGAPNLQLYKVDGETYTRMDSVLSADPAGMVNDVAWSSDGLYIAAAHVTSPYVTVYKRNGETFTRMDNPATLPTGNAVGCDFSHVDKFLSIAHTASPYITNYKRLIDCSKTWMVSEFETIEEVDTLEERFV